MHLEAFFPNGHPLLKENFLSSWRQEKELWLDYVYSIDRAYYERGKTRVIQDRFKEEEFFAEVRSIYFIGVKQGCRIIDLEPETERVDFTFSDREDDLWHAEVKCPSYGKEIFERDGSKADKLERKKLPKYISEEGFSFNFDVYSDEVRKAALQFKKGDNNILILSDDRFVALSHDNFFEENVHEAVKEYDHDSKISSVMTLNVECPVKVGAVDEIEYSARFSMINKEPIFFRA